MKLDHSASMMSKLKATPFTGAYIASNEHAKEAAYKIIIIGTKSSKIGERVSFHHMKQRVPGDET